MTTDRRQFLTTTAAAGAALALGRHGAADDAPKADDRTFATVADAIKAPPEKLAYVVCTRSGKTGGGTGKPDYLAVVDLDPASKTYSQVVHRVEVPHAGDELHHFGWNACSSCHGARARRFLIVPGFTSGRLYVIDTQDPRAPRLHKTIEPDEVVKKTNLSAPHTVHCLPDGHVMISMLGDGQGNGPGGFLLLDKDLNVAGRWEKGDAALGAMRYNYDFWYQPRHNVMVSSEWGAPNTFRPGFKLDDVQAGKYGQRLHFWDWDKHAVAKTIDLGEKGRIPLEVRFHHNPDSRHGFVGAALSSVMWHFHHGDNGWAADPVIEVESKAVEGVPFPVPGLITDLVLSLDDKWLYFSNWLHGDLRQYDVSDPAKPRLAGQLWLGGLLGKPSADGQKYAGGPQMLQLSLDGKRLYVTNSLFSSWDDQFYPALGPAGGWLLAVECDTQKGGLKLRDGFRVDFSKEPGGASRPHEVRFPAGDSSSDIWH